MLRIVMFLAPLNHPERETLEFTTTAKSSTNFICPTTEGYSDKALTFLLTFSVSSHKTGEKVRAPPALRRGEII
jgi:hypothetical protein